MAVRNIRVDDIDESLHAQTVRFSLDGHDYEIDLGAENRDKLVAALRPYADAARVAGADTAAEHGTEAYVSAPIAKQLKSLGVTLPKARRKRKKNASKAKAAGGGGSTKSAKSSPSTESTDASESAKDAATPAVPKAPRTKVTKTARTKNRPAKKTAAKPAAKKTSTSKAATAKKSTRSIASAQAGEQAPPSSEKKRAAAQVSTPRSMVKTSVPAQGAGTATSDTPNGGAGTDT